MKISYNWLKEYVEIKIKPQALAEKLTMAGLEVTSLEEKLGDWSLEIEITSNRPDWLSHIGVAREVAAITGKKLILPKTPNTQHPTPNTQNFKVDIQDKKGCPIYSVRLIKDTAVSGSPQWLKQKLEVIGLRPVNNIVDITNFCLMETGQPLHAFDYDKLVSGKIIVRRAKENETIVAIDGVERKLNPSILVIADDKKPIAIAGIMGGKDTEVTEKTKNILLESAYFDPILIRRASRFLGITSDSSYRFERSVDLENILPASSRAVNLIEGLAKGKLISSVVVKAKVNKEKSEKINLSSNAVENLLGIKIHLKKIKQILTALQFKVKQNKNYFIVEIPPFRQDVRIEADLIEEIARIFGFENLPQTLPAIKISAIEPRPMDKLKSITNQFFASIGFSEIISYNLISQDLLTKANLDYSGITEIKNPLSKEQEMLSPSIIPGLLSAVKNNLNHSIKDLKLFEIAKKYSKAAEVSCLGIAMCGEKSDDWLRGKKEKIGFFDLKGAIEEFFSKIGIYEYKGMRQSSDTFGISAEIWFEAEKIGILGEVSVGVLANWDIKQKGIFLAEINLEKLASFTKLKKTFTRIANFPSVVRDISLVAAEEVSAGEIFNIAGEIAGALLVKSKIIELYRGGQIPQGSKGIVVSLEYQAKGRTLTDNEVNQVHEKICQALKEKLQAKIR